MANGSVFIIENDQKVLDDYRDKLERLDYTISGTAATPAVALESRALQTSDVVLLNLKLNVAVKVKTANKVIQQKFQIPVVFHSAEKPFDEPTLSSVLEKVLRIYRT